MAAIFQIRRGSGSVSLTDGELYLHKASGSLQVSLGTTPITLARLDQINSGSLNLSGDITASNAYFSGDVAISGNLFLGNTSGDNISVPGVFTTNLVPGTNGTLDLGTNGAKWRTVWANSVSASFSGSVNGIDVTILSSSIDSQFDAIGIETASLETRAVALATITGSLIVTASNNTISIDNLNTFSGSQLIKDSTLQTYTSSLETRMSTIGSVTSSLETRMSTIGSVTSSLETRMVEIGVVSGSLIASASIAKTTNDTQDISITNINSTTASLNISVSELNSWSASARIELSNLESTSASVNTSLSNIHAYTSSLKTAIELTGSSVTILGDLVVKGTQTTLDSTTIQLGDNIIELNGSANTNGGLIVKDPTGGSTISGSLLWDATSDYWKAGIKDGESKILLAGGDNVFTSSAQLTQLNEWTASTKVSLTNLESKSASVDVSISELNNWSASARIELSNLESTSASVNISISNLNTFSGSQLQKDSTLEIYTASIETRMIALRNETASIEERLSVIAPLTASYNNRWDALSITTASLINDTNNLESFSGSQLTQNQTLGFYTASIDTILIQIGVVSGSLITTASNHEQRLDELELKSASVDTSVFNLNSYTQSVNTQLTSIYQTTASLNLYSSSALISMSAMFATASNHETRIDYIEGVAFGGINLSAQFAAIQIVTSSLNSFTSSANVRLNNLESTSASVNTSISNINSFTSSQLTQNSSLATITGSLITSASNLTQRVNAIESVSGTFARTNSENTFNGSQTISGSLYVTQDLVILGSSSIQNVSSSTLNIGTNIITVAVNQPSVRFGGLAIIDSGSSGQSGSFLYDSVDDEFIFVHKGDGTNITSSHFVLGPETYNNLGNETYLTNNRLPKGTGKEHLVDSTISDDGTIITLGSNTFVQGTFYATGTTLVSGSSQITYSGLSGIPAGIVSGSSQLSSILPAGTVSGSSQVLDILSSLNTYTGSNDTTNTNQNSRLDQLSTASGSAITRLTALEVETSNLESFTSSINTTIKSKLDTDGVISGSSQINLGSAAGNITLATQTTGNYVANLVEGTGVTITNNSGENATPTIAIGQVVSTSSNVQFGSIGVGTTASGVSGEIRATGDIVAFYSSDERLKENIQPIQNALSKIESISGNTYDWKKGFENIHSHTGSDLGVIAQEVQSVLPEVVTERETGYLAVDYIKLVPVLIEAIKELSAKIDRLENK